MNKICWALYRKKKCVGKEVFRGIRMMMKIILQRLKVYFQKKMKIFLEFVMPKKITIRDP